VIYLDHNATTPVDPRVRAAMEPFLGPGWGNPSSAHSSGREARRAVENARDEVAALIGADSPDEVVFTSGGTESDALALSWIRSRPRDEAFLTSSVEHPAVGEVARGLEQEGYERRIVRASPTGALDEESLAGALAPGAAFVSVMAANNEYGGVFPIAEVSRLARASGAIVHSDAVAALGRIPIDVNEMGVDLLSLSGHKIHGPKGVGALYVRRGVDLPPMFPGGGQERRRRGGTENVPGIVGLGAAARILRDNPVREPEAGRLRDLFERRVREQFEGVRIWGRECRRLSNTSAIAFPGSSGEALLIALDLDGIAVSTGSACSSGTLSPSPSILALGATPEEARSTLRFSFGAGNLAEEVPLVVESLAAAVGRVRAS
jgi:cysteine desulfurase